MANGFNARCAPQFINTLEWWHNSPYFLYYVLAFRAFLTIKLTDMNKELFIEAIEAIQKQVQLDIEISKHLGKAFPDAFEANLLPNYLISRK